MPEDLFAVNDPESGDKATRALIRGLTEEAVRLEAQAKALDKQASELKAEKKVRVDSIIQHLIELNTKTTKWDDGLAITRRVTMHPRCPPENAEAFKKWLKRNKYWGLANIPSNTIKSLLKERQEKGQKIPAYIESFEEQGLSISGKAVILREEASDGSASV